MRFTPQMIRAAAGASPKAKAAGIGNATRPGSRERFAGANGEINAGSNAELRHRLVELAGLFNGEENPLTGDIAEASAAERDELAREANECLASAYRDPSNTGWAETGASISAEVTETTARLGFMRNLLARSEVNQGSIPRVRLRVRNVTAVAAVGPTTIGVQAPRDNYYLPPEVTIAGKVGIPDRDIAQGTPELLQEKYSDGLEAIMVVEDRLLVRLLNDAASRVNSVSVFSGTMTPTILSSVKAEIANWGLAASTILMSNDLIPSIDSGSEWGILDPVSRLEIVMSGILATYLGAEIRTDGYRDPRLQVLQAGSLYVTGAPQLVGAYSDRGPVTATPIGSETLGYPGRGWTFSELISMIVPNGRAVARAQRV